MQRPMQVSVRRTRRGGCDANDGCCGYGCLEGNFTIVVSDGAIGLAFGRSGAVLERIWMAMVLDRSGGSGALENHSIRLPNAFYFWLLSTYVK